jgi:phosphoribosyl 1,2-cyclic phosphodiesterase
VETYGIELKSSSCLISYITDTKFFENILESYRGDVLILNVVRKDPSEFDHLCVKDAERIIENIRPKKAVLTHFGMTMLAAKPWEVAKQLSDKTGTEVIAATDGMKLELSNI